MRLYHFKIHPFAEQELKEARNWYNLQKENLGDEFFEAVEDKLYQITKNPNRFKKIRTMSEKLF